MAKGQIFSTDLLFGMVILIFGFGLMLALAETSMYDAKHTKNERQLQEKTELALLLLTSSPIGQCDLNGTKIPYSINKDKFTIINATTQKQLKKALLLEDNNVNLSFTGTASTTTLISELVRNANIISIDANIVVCTNTTTFYDLNNCLSAVSPCTNPKISMQKVTLTVGQ